MDPSLVQEYYTTDYIEALPEGERAELIDGKLYMMASPSVLHQDIITFLTMKIGNCIEEHNKGCKLNVSPIAVYINNDKYNYVEPDLIVVCDPEKRKDKGIFGAPDFVVEIVSPTSIQMDYLRKMIKYANSGVREYWIVDPLIKKTRVYNFETEYTEDVPFTEDIHAGICEGLVVNLTEFN